jgi:hypothetical protein
MVTITNKQRLRYSKIGKSLMNKKLTTGFQLEDFNQHNKKPRMIYAQDESNIKVVNKKFKGKVYPRESYFKWDKTWPVSKRTKVFVNGRFYRDKPNKNGDVFMNGKLALGQERYLTTSINNKNLKYATKTVRIRGRKNVENAWQVPDIRLYDDNIKRASYKAAWLVTKNIDHNSRLSLIVTNKEKMLKIRKNLKGESVKNIKIQNYKKPHSFWSYINKG